MFKQKETQNLKREGGITLIALIITIIILVILAAVSINAAYNSGIIDYAVNGTQNYILAKEEESEKIESVNSILNSVMGRIDEFENVQSSTPAEQQTEDFTFTVGNNMENTSTYTGYSDETWFDWVQRKGQASGFSCSGPSGSVLIGSYIVQYTSGIKNFTVVGSTPISQSMSYGAVYWGGAN